MSHHASYDTAVDATRQVDADGHIGAQADSDALEEAGPDTFDEVFGGSWIYRVLFGRYE